MVPPYEIVAIIVVLSSPAITFARRYGHDLVLSLKNGRPDGGLGWARLANGTFLNPSDGGCDGSTKAIERWKIWLAAGYTSSTDAQKSR
jgi:hypothetical protein